MEAIGSSETLVIFWRTIRDHIPEGGILCISFHLVFGGLRHNISLHIFGRINDAAGNSDHIESNGRMIKEL
jgi:hypothetical protein